ncbi:MAG: 50S ribosomal protein L25 [Gemmatimonadaceae bacterium]
MDTPRLTARTRSETGKGVARTLRRNGETPCVIYGHAREVQPLAVGTHELERLLGHISAGSTVVEVDVGGRTSRTLLREIQRHPFRKQVLHVDFQELVAGEKVTVRIPIVLVGTADGVKNGGGILDQTMRELEIEVDPADIPNHVDVDVTALGIGHSIHVEEISLPAGVTVLDDPEATICVIAAPKAEVEEAAPAEGEEAAPSEPELIRKTKEDEAESEGE